MTELYGASDDLIEIEGDFRGECGGGDEKTGILFSDGTLASIHYGKRGIWKIDILRKGILFDKLDICDDPDAERYSDTAYFKNGIKWAYECDSIREIN